MSNYEALIQNIQSWAQKTENVRALIIIGSRARTTEKADEWSDLDLLLVAHDVTEYIKTSDWLEIFGKPLLTFTEQAFDDSYERRVLFADFLDVDFALSGPEELKTSLTIGAVRDIFQRGYQILVDKDDWTIRLSNLEFSQQEQPLSPDHINNDIHDYFYHCVWTAKKLQRGELWTAMNCLNCYMKNKLLHMIETHARLFGEGKVDTWHNGRLLEKWAAPTITQRLPGSFTDYNQDALVAALHHQMTLYHDIATQVANKLDILYPLESVENVQSWTLRYIPGTYASHAQNAYKPSAGDFHEKAAP